MSRFGKYLGPPARAGSLVPAGSAARADPWAAPVRGSWVRTGPAARGDVVLASHDSGAEIVVGAAENLNVRQAAVFLAGDIETISGYRPPIVTTPTPTPRPEGRAFASSPWETERSRPPSTQARCGARRRRIAASRRGGPC